MDGIEVTETQDIRIELQWSLSAAAKLAEEARLRSPDTWKAYCPECRASSKVSGAVISGIDVECNGVFNPIHDGLATHHHDPDATTEHWICTEGHNWQLRRYRSCGACDWKGGPEPERVP